MQWNWFLLLILLGGSPVQNQGNRVNWTVLKPVHLQSSGGAALIPQEDGSILASGKSPDRDIHTIEVRAQLDGITGFRLEALPDPSQPQGGPGRANNGNFVLSELGVSAAPLSRARAHQPKVLVAASATYAQPENPVYLAIDNNPNSGWAVFPQAGTVHTAFFKTASPITNVEGTCLRFTLSYFYGSSHVLGRFRIAATTDPDPLSGTEDPCGRGWSKTQQRVNEAIDRGVDALLAEQEIDGSWREHQRGYPSGQTALTLYTLLKCGVLKSHPSARRALEFLRIHPPKKTYSVSCLILALCALKDESVQSWIKELVDALVSWEQSGFAYPEGRVDLSNTQYGALALHTAAIHGFRVPRKAWESLARAALRNQRTGEGRPITGSYQPVGFGYHPQSEPTGSMTAAGVGILGICEEQLGRASQESLTAKMGGVEWLAKYFSVTCNPHPGHKKPGIWDGADEHLYYYLYGLERAGAILGLTHMGPHDWYRNGALFLVDRQEGTGKWAGNQTKTCFALLFLSKATSQATGQDSVRTAKVYGKDDPKKEVSLRAAGDSPLAMWISRFGDKWLKYLEWDGEEGKGLRVIKVEYKALLNGKPGDSKLLASVEGNPSEPSGSKSFAAQYSFPKSGVYTIYASVSILVPGTELNEEDAVVELKSDPVKVTILAAQDEELFEYSRDPLQNLLAPIQVNVKASTELHNDWGARNVVDNFQALCWLSADSDPTPWISLDPERPVLANTLLLSHATTFDPARTGRIRRLELIVNNTKPGYTVEMNLDDKRKTVFSFGRPRVIRSLRLQVLEVKPCHTDRRGVGFGEIELQLRRTSQKGN